MAFGPSPRRLSKLDRARRRATKAVAAERAAAQRRRVERAAWLDGPTWTCHVCGDERPDALIAVHRTFVSLPSGLSVTTNVRYCADRLVCTHGAPHVGPFSETASRFVADLEAVRAALGDVYTAEGVQVWLTDRNGALAGERPIDLIAVDRTDEVLALVRTLSPDALD